MLAKLLLVPVVGLAHLLLLYTVVQLGPAQDLQLAFPASLEDIRQLAARLAALNTQHPVYILSLFRYTLCQIQIQYNKVLPIKTKN